MVPLKMNYECTWENREKAFWPQSWSRTQMWFFLWNQTIVLFDLKINLHCMKCHKQRDMAAREMSSFYQKTKLKQKNWQELTRTDGSETTKSKMSLESQKKAILIMTTRKLELLAQVSKNSTTVFLNFHVSSSRSGQEISYNRKSNWVWRKWL